MISFSKRHFVMIGIVTVFLVQAICMHLLGVNPLETISLFYLTHQWIDLGALGLIMIVIILVTYCSHRPKPKADRQSEILLRESQDRVTSAIDRLRLMRRDPLTNLHNLRMFDEAIVRDLAGNEQPAVLLLDLDRFHEINDKFGFRSGDTIIQDVGERLHKNLPDRSTLARVFSDRFGILIPGQPKVKDIETLAFLLEQVFDSPFPVAGQNIKISASIGVAQSPKDGNDATSLIRAATSALHSMKATGGGHWRLFNTDTDDGDSGLRRDLRVAVPARQIKPFYQLIVDLATNQVVGLEVLARWDHPVQGMVSPDRFIALAEKEGWLGEITTGLLEQVANDVTAWPVELFFSFNIAASQLKEFVAYVIAQKEWIVSRLPADRIEIELTEYALVTDFDTTREAVQVLHENGSKVVLDDFGAGYTNFRHFRGIQFDRLKIDRELVLDMLVDPRAEICVRSIAELGRVLGIDVVAKGISSPEIAARAQKFGCHLGQGSLYSMPVPANEVSALIEKFTKLISPKIRHGV